MLIVAPRPLFPLFRSVIGKKPRALVHDPEGNLWLGSQDSLNVLSAADWTATRYGGGFGSLPWAHIHAMAMVTEGGTPAYTEGAGVCVGDGWGGGGGGTPS